MPFTKSELSQLFKLCKQHGVTSYKAEGLEFTIDHSLAERPKTRRSKLVIQAEKDAIAELEPEYDELDALFWSSAGIPDTSNGDK